MKKTIENLAKAFVGESQARNRYSFYAKAATKEGFGQIARLFEQTAEQEKVHASTLYKMLGELLRKSGSSSPTVQADVGVAFGDTVANLRSAIGGEGHEHESMYPEFAKVAQEEGLADVAARLLAIARAEAAHEARFKHALEAIEQGTLYKSAEQATWACDKCGYTHEGTEPPERCPACNHAKNYFQQEA